MSRLASDGLKKAADTRRCAKMSRSRAVMARRRAGEVVERTENLLDRVKGETRRKTPVADTREQLGAMPESEGV
jgi:hypothetical protein